MGGYRGDVSGGEGAGHAPVAPVEGQRHAGVHGQPGSGARAGPRRGAVGLLQVVRAPRHLLAGPRFEEGDEGLPGLVSDQVAALLQPVGVGVWGRGGRRRKECSVTFTKQSGPILKGPLCDLPQDKHDGRAA